MACLGSVHTRYLVIGLASAEKTSTPQSATNRRLGAVVIQEAGSIFGELLHAQRQNAHSIGHNSQNKAPQRKNVQ